MSSSLAECVNADDVPGPVKQSFAKKFPAATNVKYDFVHLAFQCALNGSVSKGFHIDRPYIEIRHIQVRFIFSGKEEH